MINPQDVIDYALGTCKSETEIADHFGTDAETILEILSDGNIERCGGCEWWFEASDLIDDDCEVVGCADCRDKETHNA